MRLEKDASTSFGMTRFLDFPTPSKRPVLLLIVICVALAETPLT